jgi:hypothetical protein
MRTNASATLCARTHHHLHVVFVVVVAASFNSIAATTQTILAMMTECALF